MDIVRNIPLLAGLTAKEQDDFIKGGGVFSYASKKSLFMVGDTVNFVYILCNGAVREFRETASGHEITLNIYKAGDVFCKTELFLKDNLHLTNAKTVDNAYVMELPIAPFKDRLEKYPAVKNRLVSALAQLAVMKQLEVEQQAMMTAAQLLAAFLWQLRDSHGFDPRGFTLPYKKTLIASRLGMEIATLSRALPRLKEHGIHVKGTYVSFMDAQSSSENVVKLFPSPANMRRWVNDGQSYGSQAQRATQ